MVSTRDFDSISIKLVKRQLIQFWIGLSELFYGISHGKCSNTVGCLYLLLLIVLFKQRIVLPVAHFLHPRCDVGITCPETVKCDRGKSENRIHAHSNL